MSFGLAIFIGQLVGLALIAGLVVYAAWPPKFNISEADIVRVIDNKIGTAIDLFGGHLTAYALEDGIYAVAWESGDSEDEVLFDDPWQAAAFFLQKRRDLRLGFDFEAEPVRHVIAE